MFTAAQWLLIDIANQYGLDKELFPKRLAFGREMLEYIKAATNLNELKQYIKPFKDEADEPEMFAAACLATWDVTQGEPTHYMIGLDSLNSGPQLLSLLTKCKVGMQNTGSLDTGVRPDLYSLIDTKMKMPVGRKIMKTAVVPYAYASEAVPMAIFGDDVDDFKAAYMKTVPGAAWAKNVLVNSWNSNALYHEITAPDGAVAHIKVIGTKETTGRFKGHSFTYVCSENAPRMKGENKTKANAANTTHAYDGFILRELDARCDYVPEQVEMALKAIAKHEANGSNHSNEQLVRLCKLSERHNQVSVRAVNYILEDHLNDVSPEYLNKLKTLLRSLQKYQPFPVREIHDEFATGPNNVSVMKQTYNNLLAETYESSWLFDVIEDLTGKSYHHMIRIDLDLVPHIKTNTYALN